MKEIKIELKGIEIGQAMDLAMTRQDARLYKKRIYCGYYRMAPLYATPEGFIVQIPDDEPEDYYK